MEEENPNENPNISILYSFRELVLWVWPAVLVFIISSVFFYRDFIIVQSYLILNIFGTYIAYQYYKWRYFHTQTIEDEFKLITEFKSSFFERLFPDDMLWVWLLCFVIKFSIFLISQEMYESGQSVSRTNWLVDTFGILWWDAEGLSDFAGDYIMFRNNFLNGVSLYGEAFNGRYLYPPLYYYIINIFSYWTIYSAPLVMLICNMMTGYFVFHLAIELGAKPRAAKIMMVLQLLSPINLYFSDFIWQNAGVFTTFVVWAMLAISRNQYKKGMVIIGIAIGIKQVAAFFLPVMLFGIIYKEYMKPKEQFISKLKIIEYLKSIPWSALIFYGLIPVEIFLISSLPYIVTIPNVYFGFLLGGMNLNIEHLTRIFSDIIPIYAEGNLVGYFPNLSLSDPNNSYQVNYRSALDVAIAWLGHQWGIPVQYTVWISILFHYQAFFIISLVGLFIYYWFLVKNKDVNFQSAQEFNWILWFMASIMCFASILFVDKGVYKYYLMTMTPFWSIFNVIGPLNHEKWKNGQTFRNQIYGGGSIFHMISAFSLQLGILIYNKWLAIVVIYIPLFLIDCIRILWFRYTKKHTIQNQNEEQKSTPIPKTTSSSEETQEETNN